MTDKFQNHAQSLTSPAVGGSVVTPSDTVELPTYSRAIYVGNGGNLCVELIEAAPGVSLTFQNVQGGMVYPVRARKIRATGTTATGIVCMW